MLLTGNVIRVHEDCMMVIPGESAEASQSALKKMKPTEPAVVSPTLPMLALEPFSTTTLAMDPEFRLAHQLDIDARAVGSNATGGVIFLRHWEKHRIVLAHGPVQDTLARFITRALPHARKEHSVTFWDGAVEIEWETLLVACPAKTILFEPLRKHIKCLIGEHGCQLNADVTWNVTSALACAAVALQCHPGAIMLLDNGILLKSDDFLFEFDKTEFQIAFRMIAPSYVPAQVEASQEDSGLRPVDASCVRLYARHPNRKVVRSCMATMSSKVNVFVDIASSTSWRMVLKGQFLPDQVTIHDLVAMGCQSFEVEWDTMAPWRSVCVSLDQAHFHYGSALFHQLHPDVPCVKRWVRSPFKAKPDVLAVPHDVAVVQLGASFLSHTRINTSILCLCGSHVIHPVATIADVPEAELLSFRLCPLKGGAKRNGMDETLTSVLLDHGVPKEAVQARVRIIKDKCNPESLKDALQDADKLWPRLKEVANDARVRLVTSQELADWKKASAQKPPPSVNNRPTKKVKISGPEIRADLIDVSMEHFKVDEASPTFLEKDRFGPDQEGLAIMNASEARLAMKQQVLSCGALAILVVGSDLNGFSDPIQIPAHWKRDGAPLALRAVLLNFGDKPVEYCAAVPVLQVAQVEATVIEFCIAQKFTPTWPDTAIPLNYLGKQVTILRDQISCPFGLSDALVMTRCGHQKAVMWKGYIKVADALLDQVLAKSGVAGVFFTPKGADHRADGRFVPIPLTAGSLDDALSKAALCEHGLGIALRGDKFAVRTRREHADEVRKIVSPDATYVEVPSISDDECLYILKNVPG